MHTGNSLPFQDLADRHRGLTEATAAYMEEAARVCLDRHHESPTQFTIKDGGVAADAIVEWETTDERTRAAHANEIDATEGGAYACAIASTELVRGLFALRRAETLTGADYYLAPEGTEPTDLEGCLRLEVSGSDRATPAQLSARLVQKLAQAKRGESNLPAIAAVVGFQSKSILIGDVAAE